MQLKTASSCCRFSSFRASPRAFLCTSYTRAAPATLRGEEEEEEKKDMFVCFRTNSIDENKFN